MKKISFIYKLIIFIYIIELCCAYCLFENLHNDHKILAISDKESLKKENIDINLQTIEFNKILQKTIDLKNNIEKEINEINKLYENTKNNLIKFYEKKHEVLTKEENDLKEKLEIEVTKVKEKLEYFLSETNNEIKLNERINQGIKKFEKEEKNMIKTLSYISKINKNQKQMKKLFQQLMRNLKISFQEEKSNIKYDEYYFNGIPIPKNIKFSDISCNSINISWEIDNYNIINIDNNKIKFKIEMRKDNKNEKFIQVYEGNEKKCNINNLIKNTDYEFRICSFYNDNISLWSEFQKIKTKNIDLNCDSVILNESQKKNEFLEKIFQWSGYKKMDLIYRGTKDGSASNNFHNKCDNQGPTITLYKNEKGNIFGGYSPISWGIGDKSISDSNFFIFTLTNIYNTEPTKFPSKKNSTSNCYHGNSYGPYFYDIRVYNNFLNDNSYSNFPYYYEDILGKGYPIFTGINNNNYFKIKEIEVFKLS